jgi:hypothetical protein
MSTRWDSTPRLIDLLTVSRNVTLTFIEGSRERRVDLRVPILPGYELGSIGTESSLRNWQLQNNGKKGIRRCKEDSMCDLK